MGEIYPYWGRTLGLGVRPLAHKEEVNGEGHPSSAAHTVYPRERRLARLWVGCCAVLNAVNLLILKLIVPYCRKGREGTRRSLRGVISSKRKKEIKEAREKPVLLVGA